MLYRKKSFSLPATNQSGDCSQGHAMLDKRGKCIRCGANVRAAEHSRIIAEAFEAKGRHGR